MEIKLVNDIIGKEFVYLSKTGGRPTGIVKSYWVYTTYVDINQKTVSFHQLMNNPDLGKDLYEKYIPYIKSTNDVRYKLNEIMIKRTEDLIPKFPGFITIEE